MLDSGKRSATDLNLVTVSIDLNYNSCYISALFYMCALFKVARNSFLARAAEPLIVRARASTPSSRRCKFDDPSKILQNLYFNRQYL